MQVSQDAAREYNEQYALVTYDLTIVKPAMTIQEHESPEFDNLFICFGAFHIQMAYLKHQSHWLANILRLSGD